MSLRCDWCSHQAFAYAVKHWHYSRSLPMPPLNMVGAWEDGRFIGCVAFGRGANKRLFRPYGLTLVEGCELVRVALTAHQAPTSQIVTIALRMIRKRNPRLRLVISFADPAQGHHGGIYQALGWLYLGQTPRDWNFISADGRRWHRRMISPTGYARTFGKRSRVLTPADCKRVHLPGKHRYALPLDEAMRVQLAPLALPYPKREPHAVPA